MPDKTTKIFPQIIVAFWLLILATHLVSAVEVKTIKNPQELPEKFSSLARTGDYLLSDNHSLLLVGVKPRDFPAIKSYPWPEANGAILAFAPAGSELTNEIIAGPVQIRAGFDYYYPVYRIVKAPLAKPSQLPVSFELQGSVNQQTSGKRRGVDDLYVYSRKRPDSHKIGL